MRKFCRFNGKYRKEIADERSCPALPAYLVRNPRITHKNRRWGTRSPSYDLVPELVKVNLPSLVPRLSEGRLCSQLVKFN